MTEDTTAIRMHKEYIIKKIRGLIIGEFEIDEKVISHGANLKDDYGLESLNFAAIAEIAKKNCRRLTTGSRKTK